jgi:serine/threonine protein kinase
MEVAKALNILEFTQVLGRGQFGRVLEFEVSESKSDSSTPSTVKKAVKIVVGDSNTTRRSRIEYVHMESIIKHAKQLALTSSSALTSALPSSVDDFCESVPTSSSSWVAFVLTPVGEVVSALTVIEKPDMYRDIFASLRCLHVNGIVHGDARIQNVLKRAGKRSSQD